MSNAAPHPPGWPLGAFVVDDEPLARRHLRGLLAEAPDVVCLGEAADGPRALADLARLRPAVVFLDVELPGMSGLALVARLPYRPALILTTAYDRYAVPAFDLEAVDYLLKPFGRRRFLAALDRARRAVAAHRTPDPVPDRLLVRTPRGIVPVPLAEVERFAADDDYVAVHARGRRHLVAERLGALAARLDPRRFVRVHRSHVVNLDFVEALVRRADARLEVRMRDGTRVVASRAHSRTLRRRSS